MIAKTSTFVSICKYGPGSQFVFQYSTGFCRPFVVEIFAVPFQNTLLDHDILPSIIQVEMVYYKCLGHRVQASVSHERHLASTADNVEWEIVTSQQVDSRECLPQIETFCSVHGRIWDPREAPARGKMIVILADSFSSPQSSVFRAGTFYPQW